MLSCAERLIQIIFIPYQKYGLQISKKIIPPNYLPNFKSKGGSILLSYHQ